MNENRTAVQIARALASRSHVATSATISKTFLIQFMFLSLTNHKNMHVHD